ncbi:hypothetical protein D3C72_2256700 [compost metagenome]
MRPPRRLSESSLLPCLMRMFDTNRGLMMARSLSKLILLSCATVLAGCATVSPVPPVCPQLPPVPAAVMQPKQSDYSQKMRSFLFDSPQTLTIPPAGLPPASKS